MRFTLIDRIAEIDPGKRILAMKNLSMAEEYLADHFPGFPVMPGVLMLEAMVEAGGWLIRVSEDFAHSLVVLKQVNNVKYGSFVQPGQTLKLEVEITGQSSNEVKIKARGTVDGRLTVTARLVLERYNLADKNPEQKRTDEQLKKQSRELLDLLYVPASSEEVSSG